MFFRAFDAVETWAERRVSKKKAVAVVLFFMRVGVAKVGFSLFYKEKTKREERGETLNPKLPKKERKKAL